MIDFKQGGNMKLLKEDSEPGKKLNEVEELMRKHNISIDFAGGWVFVTIGDNEFRLLDKENNEPSFGFPRTFDSERLELIESSKV